MFRHLLHLSKLLVISEHLFDVLLEVVQVNRLEVLFIIVELLLVRHAYASYLSMVDSLGCGKLLLLILLFDMRLHNGSFVSNLPDDGYVFGREFHAFFF